MFSEHLVLLPLVSESDPKVSELFEIGTHDAKTALNPKQTLSFQFKYNERLAGFNRRF